MRGQNAVLTLGPRQLAGTRGPSVSKDPRARDGVTVSHCTRGKVREARSALVESAKPRCTAVASCVKGRRAWVGCLYVISRERVACTSVGGGCHVHCGRSCLIDTRRTQVAVREVRAVALYAIRGHPPRGACPVDPMARRGGGGVVRDGSLRALPHGPRRRWRRRGRKDPARYRRNDGLRTDTTFVGAPQEAQVAALSPRARPRVLDLAIGNTEWRGRRGA